MQTPTVTASPARTSHARLRGSKGRLLLLATIGWLSSFGGLAVAHAQEDAETAFHRIGPTATVVEVSTGLPFAARVDTGATRCSIHCEAMEIEDASPDPGNNVGKPIRFLTKNKKGESEWIESQIVSRVVVRTPEQIDERYTVRLDLRWKDVEKKVLVTLNDRQGMNYPLLLGRNFLRGDFLVDLTRSTSKK
jgi:hypothetical protein